MTDSSSTARVTMSTRLRRLAIIAPLAATGSAMVFASASAAEHPARGTDNVTLCHATASASNPYVVITVDPAGAFDGHLGASHQNGEDIIPPFEYQGQTYSQNWDEEGMAIFNNDCMLPGATTTTGGGSTTTTGGGSTTTTGGGPATTAGSPTTAGPTSSLANTGGRASANVIGAAVLLSIGGGLALIAARRRTA